MSEYVKLGDSQTGLGRLGSSSHHNAATLPSAANSIDPTSAVAVGTHVDSTDASSDDTVFVQYPVRWLVLFIFSLLTITNAILWICFAPIQSRSADYFGVSKQWINWLSMSFMALYPPGYLLAFWSIDKYGLRGGLCIAAVLQAVGAWIRYFGVLGGHDNMAPHVSGFALCFVGQCLAGFAQPMFTNAPAKMSSDWFSVSQRNLATTIAAMSNPIGIALGQVVPTILVDDTGGIPTMLLVCACLATATCILCFVGVRKAPPTPPSRTTMERSQMRAEADAAAAMLGSDGLPRPVPSFWRGPLIGELRALLTDRQFLVLMIGVGLGLGLFNSVSTLTAQLVEPAGYSDDDAGIFGAILIGCGLVGAGIVGPVMDRTHAYNRILKAGLAAALAGSAFMLFSLRPGQFAVVCVAFGVLGFFMLPLLPVCMECAAECTYPTSEDASSGLLLGCGNVVGVVLIVVVGELIEDHYSTVFNAANLTLICFLTFAALLVGILYNGPLRRQAAEKAKSVRDPELGATTTTTHESHGLLAASGHQESHTQKPAPDAHTSSTEDDEPNALRLQAP